MIDLTKDKTTNKLKIRSCAENIPKSHEKAFPIKSLGRPYFMFCYINSEDVTLFKFLVISSFNHGTPVTAAILRFSIGEEKGPNYNVHKNKSQFILTFRNVPAYL